MRFPFQKLAEVLDPNRKTAALILAAGNSTRMGSRTSKQFLTVGGIPVLAHTLLSYEKAETVSQIIVAAREEDFSAIAQIKKEYGITKLSDIVCGGASRQDSAKAALDKIGEGVTFVAVADGARCFTTPEEIVRVCSKAYTTNAASAAHRLTGTIKKTDFIGKVLETVPRENLWEAQTPQVFHVALYASALQKAIADGFVATDDNSMVEHFGYTVHLIPCSAQNIKITTPDDLPLAQAIYQYRNKGGNINE